jgi:hypothetical protein
MHRLGFRPLFERKLDNMVNNLVFFSTYIMDLYMQICSPIIEHQ